MEMLRGPISDRLRFIFGLDVAEWPAARLPDEIVDMPLENYQGIKMGDRWERCGLSERQPEW